MTEQRCRAAQAGASLVSGQIKVARPAAATQ
jgi:hypothetical protein